MIVMMITPVNLFINRWRELNEEQWERLAWSSCPHRQPPRHSGTNWPVPAATPQQNRMHHSCPGICTCLCSISWSPFTPAFPLQSLSDRNLLYLQNKYLLLKSIVCWLQFRPQLWLMSLADVWSCNVQVNNKSTQNSNGTDVLSSTSVQISMNKIIDIKLPTNNFVGAMLDFAIGQVYDA